MAEIVRKLTPAGAAQIKAMQRRETAFFLSIIGGSFLIFLSLLVFAAYGFLHWIGVVR
jgi:nitrate reductase NapE component